MNITAALEARQLRDLQAQWGHLYDIRRGYLGRWLATRLDALMTPPLIADTADGLIDVITQALHHKHRDTILAALAAAEAKQAR